MAEACQKDNSKCEAADDYCNMKETSPYYATGLNPYDIRKPCGESSLCYDMTSTETFLNLQVSLSLRLKGLSFSLYWWCLISCGVLH